MISPYNTLQEQQLDKPHAPWRVLVVCILLNMTHGRQVRPMIDRFFALAPSPEALVSEGCQTNHAFEELLAPLGLARRRWLALTGMSRAYLQLVEAGGHDFWRSNYDRANWIVHLPGCGQYAIDSINIFCYGVLENVSSDTWLNRYVEWRRSVDPKPKFSCPTDRASFNDWRNP